jgi:ABC-type nickel/cobalt efflux system permease component RcnA
LNRVYERTIVVRLSANAVTVDYQLDVDESTAVVDLMAAIDKEDISGLKQSNIYESYARVYAPILADNLVASLDGKPLVFTCIEKQHQIIEHLRCTFRFQAKWAPSLEGTHKFKFRDGTYETEVGKVNLTLVSGPSLVIEEKTEPDPKIGAKSALDRTPSEDDHLREASATFRVYDEPVPEDTLPELATEEKSPSGGLLSRLFDPRTSPWMMVGLACLFGALHALQPGHGKTLVAAYLVGERGTVWHALLLGIITTLTHTGAVLVLAAVVWFFLPDSKPAQVQSVLGLGSGLVVAGMGCWLLLKRLAGQADHVHIGMSGHHHGPGGHSHSLPETDKRIGLVSLIVIGITGGIVPCGEAWALFAYSVKFDAWIAPVVQLAFSVGLASVLIAIGILVVKVKRIAGSRWEDSWLYRALPVVSAALVTSMGLWLCYESVH